MRQVSSGDTLGGGMSSVRLLVGTLKAQLRRQGISYRQVAEHLCVSEASVKRWFSAHNLSLRQLEAVCVMAGTSLTEMAAQADQQTCIPSLDEAQEQELVSDPRLLLVAIAALNRWTFAQIVDTYTFTEPELIQRLARLDRMRLIELQPHNRIRLRITPDFAWLPRGPIQRFFERQVQQAFFDSSFDAPGELRLFVSGMLGRDSNAVVRQKMERLAREFRALHDEDARLSLDERFGTSLVLAMRPWELGLFEQWRRPGRDKRFRDLPHKVSGS